MQKLIDGMKDIPIATIGITGFVSLIVLAITGWLFIDDRYVHAGEFKQYANQQIAQINNVRKQLTENELFKLELTPPDKRSDYDRALIERYKRQLQEINEANRNGRAAN